MRHLTSFAHLSIVTLLVSGLSNLHAVDFSSQIKPIFDEKCASCHGEKKQKSDLRVDIRDSLLKGGDSGIPSIVPGDPDESELFYLISEADDDEKMPPKKSKNPLTRDEIKLIQAWIKAGAKMPIKKVSQETLWSFKPVQQKEVPESANPNIQNEIDQFLAMRLKSEGLTFNQTESPVKLLRRLQVTLTGFLPSEKEAAVFEKGWQKDSHAAYEAKVDELLASPHFGERWAQHWLDAIRWSETNGSESNLYRNYAWQYRDYVIRAFNEDKPYADFIKDQLAGDARGEPRATGFLVAGPHVPAPTIGKVPADIRQARYDRLDQVMLSLGSSMMGMTLNCARCHTHKFDPIKITDYYSILANFQGVEYDYRIPELPLDHPDMQKAEGIMSKILKRRSELANTKRPQGKAPKASKLAQGVWLENWAYVNALHFKPVTATHVRIKPMQVKFNIDEIEIFEIGEAGEYSPLAPGNNIAREAKVSTNLELEFIESLNDGKIGKFKRVQHKKNKKDGWLLFDLNGAKQIHSVNLSGNREEGIETSYLIEKWKIRAPHVTVEYKTPNGQWITLGNTQKTRSDQQLNQLVKSYLDVAPDHEFIGKFIKPVKTHVLRRGSPESPGNEVNPGTIAAMVSMNTMKMKLAMTSDTPEDQRRLNFASWLASDDNPLTSRVMVNRLWHHIFGQGIVPTVNDFGNAGAKPTHPELLEWLAHEFVQDDWSMKRMIKRMVMSHAFRQSSKPVAKGMAADAGSRFLWRYPPRRAEAEVIRDSILKLTGSLDPKLGGVGYRIHADKARYKQWEIVDNHSDKTWRRMIYQERMRGVDDRMFTAFDFPDCGQVIAKRPLSTTPLQALNLMNSEFMMGQIQVMANQLPSDHALAVKTLFQRVFNRQPSSEELNAAIKLLKQHETGKQMLARTLFNSNEFIFIQ